MRMSAKQLAENKAKAEKHGVYVGELLYSEWKNATCREVNFYQVVKVVKNKLFLLKRSPKIIGDEEKGTVWLSSRLEIGNGAFSDYAKVANGKIRLCDNTFSVITAFGSYKGKNRNELIRTDVKVKQKIYWENLYSDKKNLHE